MKSLLEKGSILQLPTQVVVMMGNTLVGQRTSLGAIQEKSLLIFKVRLKLLVGSLFE